MRSVLSDSLNCVDTERVLRNVPIAACVERSVDGFQVSVNVLGLLNAI